MSFDSERETYLLSDPLGRPERDSESEYPGCFESSCCFSEGETIAEKVKQAGGEGYSLKQGEIERTQSVP